MDGRLKIKMEKLMKKGYFLGALAIIILGLGVFLGIFGYKKLGKPIAVVVHDTVFVTDVDTVEHIILAPTPKPDTFYVQEFLVDTFYQQEILTDVDTAGIIADYNRVYEYNDTILDNDKITVQLSEQIQANKIKDRLVAYKMKLQVDNVVIQAPKKRLSLYVGGEVAVNKNGLTESSLGIALKDKRDIFYKVTNNFVDGLNWNIGVGVYIPIIR